MGYNWFRRLWKGKRVTKEVIDCIPIEADGLPPHSGGERKSVGHGSVGGISYNIGIKLLQHVMVNLCVRANELGPLTVCEHLEKFMVMAMRVNVKDFFGPDFVFVHF